MDVPRARIARMVDEGDVDDLRVPRAERNGYLWAWMTDRALPPAQNGRLRRLVREMGEHLEEHAEKGFVRDGAYDQLYRDLMAIRATTLPEELDPHPN